MASKMATPAIRGLLARAADSYEANAGVIELDIQFGLSAEGYDLDRLEGDVELILNNRS